MGTTRKLYRIHNTPTAAIIQLIERISYGRRIHLGTTVDDGKGEKIIRTLTPICYIDYQRVKSMCSIEQGVSIAYRTICKCLKNVKSNLLMPLFVYTIPSILLIGQTRIPADGMFVCRVYVPPSMKYAIDTPSRGLFNFVFLFEYKIHQYTYESGIGKLWISKIRKTLCGVQLVSEHTVMFGKAFGILIRNQIPLIDICNRIELAGSIGETVQLMIKQALDEINK